MINCWCNVCKRRLKTKREHITQQDTCDRCYRIFRGSDVFIHLNPSWTIGYVKSVDKAKKFLELRGQTRIGGLNVKRLKEFILDLEDTDNIGVYISGNSRELGYLHFNSKFLAPCIFFSSFERIEQNRTEFNKRTRNKRRPIE